MASFQAKTGWDRSRKRENKNYRSDQFLTNPEQRIPKKLKKLKKLKKHYYGIFPSQNTLGKAEKERKEKSEFRSIPTQLVIENSKKIAKKFKD